MQKVFLWNARNLEHIARHGVSPEEASDVVERAARPDPERVSDRKWLVRGRTTAGRSLQVIFLVLEPQEVDVSELTVEEMVALEEGELPVYVIHARDLTTREKRRLSRSS